LVEVQIEEMFRSDRSRPIDYERAAVVDAEVKKTTKTTHRSGWRSLLKNDLTGPTLLEMSGYGLTGTYQWQVEIAWKRISTSHGSGGVSADLKIVCGLHYADAALLF
jgi:hypothetical protein